MVARRMEVLGRRWMVRRRRGDVDVGGETVVVGIGLTVDLQWGGGGSLAMWGRLRSDDRMVTVVSSHDNSVMWGLQPPPFILT